MTATVTFGGVRGVNLGGNLPFSTVRNAVKNVLVRMAACHLGDLTGRLGFATRGMIVIVMLRFLCCCMCAFTLGLGFERETHIISLVRVDAVPCAN